MQVSRDLFSDGAFLSLSDSGRCLLFMLKELEHRYTGENTTFFFRSNEDLAKDCGWSISKLKRVKKEVAKSGLLRVSKMHWVDDDGKKSEKHVTAYRLFF